MGNKTRKPFQIGVDYVFQIIDQQYLFCGQEILIKGSVFWTLQSSMGSQGVKWLHHLLSGNLMVSAFVR